MNSEDIAFWIGFLSLCTGIVLLILAYTSKSFEESNTDPEYGIYTKKEKENNRKRIIAGWSMIPIGILILLLLFLYVYKK